MSSKKVSNGGFFRNLRVWFFQYKEKKAGIRTFKFRFGGNPYPSTVTVDKNDVMIRRTDYFENGKVKRFSRFVDGKKILEVNYAERTGKIKSLYMLDKKDTKIEYEFGSTGESLTYISPKSKVVYHPQRVNELLYQLNWIPERADFRLISCF